MGLQSIKNVSFMKKFLIITIIISCVALIFNFIAMINIILIQMISTVLIVAMLINLFLLSLVLYENINKFDVIGRTINTLNHLLLLILAIAPLLVGLGGMLESAILYFILPTSNNLSMLAQVITILIMSVLVAYGVVLSVICLINLDAPKLWNF
jgi:hypothetical protein